MAASRNASGNWQIAFFGQCQGSWRSLGYMARESIGRLCESMVGMYLTHQANLLGLPGINDASGEEDRGSLASFRKESMTSASR